MGGPENYKTVSNGILEFCLVYPELCQSLFLYLGRGGGGGGRSILKDWVGDRITGLSKMFCAMLWCIVLNRTVLLYHVFVSSCTQLYCVSFCRCYKNLKMHGCNLCK